MLIDDMVIPPPPDFYIGGPVVNRTNLHSGVWGIFHIHAGDETLSGEHRDTFMRARNSLEEFITPHALYDIMEKNADSYGIDALNMLVYATDVILINEEIRTMRDA